MSQWLDKIRYHLRLQTAVTRLIYILLGTFILSQLMRIISYDVYQQFIYYFALYRLEVRPYNVWRFLTYAFIHADIIHLLINCLMLYFFSRLFTTFFTERQLLQVFIAGSVFAGLFYESIAFLMDWKGHVIGASGGITSVLLLVAAFRPFMNVRLLLMGNVSLYWIAIVFVLFDLLQLPYSNVGGHVTHLGGAVFGLLAGWYLRHNSFPSISYRFTSKSKLKKISTKPSKISFEKMKQEDATQRRIDEILDKISKSGYDSLSQEDKEFLFRQK